MSDDPQVHHVALWLCDLCLDGVGGECHVPGCSLWLNRAPDLSLRDHVTYLDALTARVAQLEACLTDTVQQLELGGIRE